MKPFEFLRRLPSRSRSVGIAFSSGRVGIFSHQTRHSMRHNLGKPSDGSGDRFAPLLAQLNQKLNLAQADCAMSLPLSQCKLTTVTLPRCRPSELRNIMQQPLFWQEYLSVHLPEYRTWWQRLRCAEADKTQVLVAAVPAKVAEWHEKSAKSAGFSFCHLGINCFDFLVAANQLGKHCYFVVISAMESFIIGCGDSGIYAKEIESNAPPEQIVSEIVRMAKGADTATATPQVAIIADPLEGNSTDEISKLMPKNFSLKVRSIQQFAGVSNDDCSSIAYAALCYKASRAYAGFSVSDNAFAGSSAKRLKPMLVGVGLLMLGMQGFVHWIFEQEHRQLSLQMAEHKALEQEYQKHQQDAAALNDAIRHKSFVLEDLAAMEASNRVSVRVLEMIEQAASHGIWLSKTEFNLPTLLYIEGRAIDNESVVRYSNVLEEYNSITEVRIKNLGRQSGDELVTFLLECSLQIPLYLTDA